MIRNLLLSCCCCLLFACAGPSENSSSSGSGKSSTSSSGQSSSSSTSSGKSSTSSSSSSSTSSSSSSSSTSSSSSSSSGSVQPRCSETLANQNKATVKAALTELFIDKKPAAINKYWAEPYLQHNPIAKSGVAAFSSIMTSLVTSASFKYEILGVFGECDLVAVIGKYSQTGTIVDMFRLKDNKIMEHWDSDTNQAAPGSVSIVDSGNHNGAQKLAIINDFYTRGLFANSSEIIDSFFDPIAQVHRGGFGTTEFSSYLSRNKIRYNKIHQIISDSRENTVMVLAEGTLNGKAYAFFDFYRISLETIEEHWDARRPVPTSTASGLSIF